MSPVRPPRHPPPTRAENGGFLIFVLLLSVLPAFASHMLVHFGVPGYAFHYVPALLALCVLGIGAMDCASTRAAGLSGFPGSIATAPCAWSLWRPFWPPFSCFIPPITITLDGVAVSTCPLRG